MNKTVVQELRMLDATVDEVGSLARESADELERMATALSSLREIVDDVFVFMNMYAKDPHNMGSESDRHSSVSPHAIIGEVYVRLAPAFSILSDFTAEETEEES